MDIRNFHIRICFLLLFLVILLVICSSTYVNSERNKAIDSNFPDAIQVPQYTVPRLVGEPFNPDDISALLDRRGLQFGGGIPVPRMDSIGLVLTQSAPAESQWSPNIPITVTYAEEIPQYEIPRFIEMNIRDALIAIENGPFERGRNEPVDSDAPEGEVIDQSPPPFEVHPIGSPVNLVYSRGNMVIVPDLTNLTIDEAERKLMERELGLGRVERTNRGEKPGTISFQNPEPQIARLKGSKVDVAIFKPDAPDPFNGSGTKKEILPWIIGIACGAIFGGFLIKKVIGGKGKDMIIDKDISVDLKPVWDVGQQEIFKHDEFNLVQCKIHLNYVIDKGKQTIKTN